VTRANDSIAVTPGAGQLVATQSPGDGKEYQVIIPSRADGHLSGTLPAYYISGLAMAKSASKHYLGLVNQPNSNVMLEVSCVSIWEETTGTVTGLARGYRLFRMTSMSAGTTISNSTIGRTDVSASDPAAPGIAASRNGLTITGLATEPIAAGAINEEEAGAGGIVTVLFDEYMTGQPILLSTGQGVTIQQDGTAGVGTFSAGMYFRILT